MHLLLAIVFVALEVANGQGTAVPWSCNLCPVGACVTDPRCPVFNNPINPDTLPHTNCHQFYLCSHGQACEMTCPPGLHWSQTLKRCEWPNVACCDPSVPCLPGCPGVCPPPVTTPVPVPATTTTVAPPPPTAPPPPPPTPPPPPPITTLPDTPCLPCAQCIHDVRCPVNENPNTPTHLPHENDCSRFYKCAFGERCPMRCKEGEHFSVQLQRCEFPQYACCDRAIPCLQFPNDPGTPVDPNPVNCRPDAGCPVGDDPMNPILLPIPGNCGAFYKCRAGDACLIQCPAGQHFSQALQRCERPEVACCNPAVACCAVCVQRRLEELVLLGVKH